MTNVINSIRAMPEQGELDLTSTGERIPSPKRNPKRTMERRHLPWENNYAAFSLEFATAAARQLCRGTDCIVYDPFLGSGTTLEAAAAVGQESFGVELNPYNAVLARCRVAIEADIRVAREMLTRALKTKKRGIVNEGTADGAKVFIDALLQTLGKRLGCLPSDVPSRLCAWPDGDFDSELVALVSALSAVKKTAPVHLRSNPAWLLPGNSPDLEGTKNSSWIAHALSCTDDICADLHLRRSAVGNRRRVAVFPGSYQDSPIMDGQIERFLTSPPYLNRLDYVNPTLPELNALGLLSEKNIDGLRIEMMGTTKMRPISSASMELPSVTAEQLLDEIAVHPTKASGTYYLRFFRQYFGDLLQFLRWLDRCSTRTCSGILVIQDSYYKEIKIPIVHILKELANSCNFDVSVAHEESRSRHMGSINPHQRAHAPRKSLTEYTLLFSR